MTTHNNATLQQQGRNISLDILRVLSMLMIIMLHSIDHSGLYENLTEGTVLYYLEEFFYAIVQVGVNCFVLLSGYFLVQSEFKLKKLGQLWVEVVFYSFVIKLVMMVAGEIPISVTSLISCFFPVFTGRYWFVTIYFGMYLLFPFYNIAIRAMSKKQHASLIIVLVLLFSVWVSVHPSVAGMNSGGGWGLAWFTVLYFIAAYFRLHYIPNGHPGKWAAAFIACPVVMTTGLYAANRLGGGILKTMVLNWWRYDSILVLTASVSLLLLFINIKISNQSIFARVIVKMSAATFGVYLIHAHANVCTEEFWQKIGMVENMQYWWFLIYQILVVVAIFCVCVMVDRGRQLLFRWISIDKAVSYVVDTIEGRISMVYHGKL